MPTQQLLFDCLFVFFIATCVLTVGRFISQLIMYGVYRLDGGRKSFWKFKRIW